MSELSELNKLIEKCQRCELRMTATQPVPGIGDRGAKYFIVGEAPGREEDAEGVPFVGRAGKRLNKLIELSGISLDECYFTNVCRCRPPDNRTPRKKEVRACSEFLWRELELVKPEVIITLGATPLALFTQSGGVSQLHGTRLKWKDRDLICQYHPAAALHAPRLWATLLDDWQNLPVPVPHDFTILDSKGINLDGMPLASMDVETDQTGKLGQWSVAFRDGEGTLCVMPYFGQERKVQWGNCPIVFHNAKYDLRQLKEAGLPQPKNIHDTMIQGFCLGLGKQAPKEDAKSRSGSDMVGGLGLKYLARRHLGMSMIPWEQVKDHPELVPEYNAKDSVATYLLAEKWLPIMPKHYFDIDLPLLPVLMAMEDKGIQIDPTIVDQLGKELDKRLGEFDLPFSSAFNNMEIQSYVYGTLGIEPWKFTDTGAPSVEKEVLEVIDDPTIKQLIEYKELYKEKGTYVENYTNAMDSENRIHYEIKQTSTSTSRLSIARPNLQNVFKRDERVKLRAMFTAKEGHLIVRVDYNQLDYRALAAITQDPILIVALNANKKIHQVTADEMGISYDDAKTTNFGVLFGEEAWGLSQKLHIPIDEARDFLRRYFIRFPNIGKYRAQMTEIAKRDKKVTIPFTNRTRRIDAMYFEQWRVQQEGIREAINLPVQGLEAEVVKICMIDLCQKHGLVPILQIHDELLFEIPTKDAKDFALWLKEYIPTIVEFGGMKFPVGVGVGKNWYESMQNEGV